MKTCNVLGVNVSAINMGMALRQIDSWIRDHEQHYVCVTGVHGVMESQKDEALKRIHNAAGMVTPDGMPLVWINHLRGNTQVDRVYGPDLMLAVCGITNEANQEGIAVDRYRHFLYGGTEETLQKLEHRLKKRNPKLCIAGAYAPPFRPLTPEEDTEVIMRIHQSQADIVWVGLSTPKQERWMAAHVGRLKTPVMIGVGAAFDFHAGNKPQAPRWMQRSGLEWLFRLFSEPGRLFKRYLVNNPKFLLLFLAQELHLKNYDNP